MVEVNNGLAFYFPSHGLSDVEEEANGIERTAEISHQEGQFWELGQKGSQVEVCKTICEAFAFLEFADELVVRKNDYVRKGKIFQLDSQRQMYLVDVKISNE